MISTMLVQFLRPNTVALITYWTEECGLRNVNWGMWTEECGLHIYVLKRHCNLFFNEISFVISSHAVRNYCCLPLITNYCCLPLITNYCCLPLITNYCCLPLITNYCCLPLITNYCCLPLITNYCCLPLITNYCCLPLILSMCGRLTVGLLVLNGSECCWRCVPTLCFWFHHCDSMV